MISHEIKSIVNQSFDDSHYIDDGRYDMMMIIIIINGESLERGGGGKRLLNRPVVVTHF